MIWTGSAQSRTTALPHEAGLGAVGRDVLVVAPGLRVVRAVDLRVADDADRVVHDLDRHDDVAGDLVALEVAVTRGEGARAVSLGRTAEGALADRARFVELLDRFVRGLGGRSLVLSSVCPAGRSSWPNGVPTALLASEIGAVTFRSSGEAGESGLTFSSAEAMPVPSISKPPVTSAVWRPRFAHVCMGCFSFISGSLTGLWGCARRIRNGVRAAPGGEGTSCGRNKAHRRATGIRADAAPSDEDGLGRVSYPWREVFQSGVTPGCVPGVRGVCRRPPR